MRSSRARRLSVSAGSIFVVLLAASCSPVATNNPADKAPIRAHSSRRPKRPAALRVVPSGVPATQLTAVLSQSEAVQARPGLQFHSVGLVEARRPITGEQTVLPVLGATRKSGVFWLRVMLPGRPDGHVGWIRQQGARLSKTHWHLVVETSKCRLLVYDAGRLVKTFSAIVGKPSTPTPLGQFFVEEEVTMPATAPGAPYALALSARSRVFKHFDGGPGQIAIHGIENLAGRLGEAVSHGCVRVSTRAVSWLVAAIAPGVPVTIEK